MTNKVLLDFSRVLKNDSSMKYCILFLVWFVSLCYPIYVQAYADFIGYGYSSCMTCHYNGQGNGPLNDYGRGVFAAEVISKSFMKSTVTDEELSEKSGFLGKTSLPWWFRPGVKYRGLWFQTNPGSKEALSKFVTMQADASAVIHFDQDQKWVFVSSFGYYPVPANLKNDPNKPSEWISREHYLRYLKNDNLIFFVGLMDKAFGIRTVDHTAFSRVKTGLAQNDQTHGVMTTYKMEPWDYTAHAFLGNLSQDADLRQKGFSLMAEKDLHQFHRIGSSFMMSQNDYVNWLRVSAHSKLGFGKGNSFLTEAGYLQNKPKSGATKNGGYAMAQSMALIRRGFFFLSQAEYFNQSLSTKSPDNLKWTFGLVSFPYLKTEFRLTLVNGRDLSDETTAGDSWAAQMQLHLSL